MFTRRRICALIAMLLLLAAVPTAMAFEGRDGETVVIEAGEVVDDDLYVAAERLVINGTVNGDLFAAGNEVEINGTVTGDVLSMGSLLLINGTVEDDVRAGGTAVVVAEGGSVGGDLLAGGYGIEVADGAQVNGDVLFGGYGTRINGQIGGDVRGAGLGVEINGAIAGDVKLDVGSSADQAPFDPLTFNPNVPDELPRVEAGLRIGDGAAIGGDLAYESSAEGEVSADSVNGALNFEQTAVETAQQTSFAESFGARLWQNVQRWFVLVLIGWLFLRFAPSLLPTAANKIADDTGSSVVSGVLLLIGVPFLLTIGFFVILLLAVLFGALSLGGISSVILGIGVMLLSLDLIIYVLAVAFVGYIIVGWLVGKRVVNNADYPIIQLAVGTLLLMLLTAIPVIGGIVGMIVSVLGLGALWLWWRGRNDVANIEDIKAMPRMA